MTGNPSEFSACVASTGDANPGDIDGDGDVDLDDHGILAGCLAGPIDGGEAGCESADLDGDGDCDMADFAGLQLAYGG